MSYNYFNCILFQNKTRQLLVAQSAKNLPAMQETWVRSLGQEFHLEKEMATHSSILAWKLLGTDEPGGSTGSQKSDMTEQLNYYQLF